MLEVVPPPVRVDALDGVLLPGRYERLTETTAPRVREALAGRSIVNVNSTSSGGGVAEMLQALLPLVRGIGIDARWTVIDGDPDFFVLTKRVHDMIHGLAGDGRGIQADDVRMYESVSAENERELRAVLAARDVVVLHDPQTAGLARHLAAAGFPVVWRCHIGSDHSNAYTDEAWEFLRRYLDGYVDAYVFTRAQYAPAWVPRDRLHVITPSIDPLAPKNRALEPETVLAILQRVGIVSGPCVPPPAFVRGDGSPAQVHRVADLIMAGPAPEPSDPLVVQVSRWDVLKDPSGVMRAFAEHVLDSDAAHLVVAGPAVTGVADDPDATAVLQDCWTVWRSLPHATRLKVTLACLPMDDGDENATIVNALQRHASVVVQKSLAEGFGLTVTEAAYKRRPVVASAIGGIADQIEDKTSGLLVRDPYDLATFGQLVRSLLDDPVKAQAIGNAGYDVVLRSFLPDTQLERWGTLLEALAATR